MTSTYRVHSLKVKCERWCPTKAEAIAALECQCKRAGIAVPLRYPSAVSGDCVTSNEIAYPR